MREIFPGLLTGFLFGLGLCLSSMTDPAVIQGFLDPLGEWKPALLFVMAGAVAVTFVGYRLAWAHDRPLFATKFSLPTISAIDAPLFSGAAIFGVGWVIARVLRLFRLRRAVRKCCCSCSRCSSA